MALSIVKITDAETFKPDLVHVNKQVYKDVGSDLTAAAITGLGGIVCMLSAQYVDPAHADAAKTLFISGAGAAATSLAIAGYVFHELKSYIQNPYEFIKTHYISGKNN